MNLIEIAQEARPGELFNKDDNDTEFYFDDDGELMVSDDNGKDFAYKVKQEDILSNKWNFVWSEPD